MFYKFLLILVQNLTEFDKFLEEHKDELMRIEAKEDLTSAEFDVQELDIEQADQEVSKWLVVDYG